MDIKEKALKKHIEWQGKIEIVPRAELKTAKDLSLAYTPGVAEPCLEIQRNPEKSFLYTRRSNLIAVVTDGSAVLGLGNIGALAGMPVMEGKCALFKEFGNVDAFPICINSADTDEIVDTIYRISGSFGGINLEDISAPRCFEIEKKLKRILDIPVFHDDQHGTAVCAAAALINALKLTGKRLCDIKCVINGAGAAGDAICRLLLKLGAKNIIMCNRAGALYNGREDMNESYKELALITNPNGERGALKEVIKNADVFIGVSAPGTVTREMVASMNGGAVVFALANPVPEIMPDEAQKGGAEIIGTGRSDFPNQINNLLVFPGIFRGALDVRASDINSEMKTAAVYALASAVSEDKLDRRHILPDSLDKKTAAAIAKAVAQAAVKSGTARV